VVSGGTPGGLLQPGEGDQGILGLGRELAEDTPFPERMPWPPLGVLLPYPAGRDEVGTDAPIERGLGEGEQLVEAQPGEVRAVEGRDRERVPAVPVLVKAS
jgi:hypothetical protein